MKVALIAAALLVASTAQALTPGELAQNEKTYAKVCPTLKDTQEQLKQMLVVKLAAAKVIADNLKDPTQSGTECENSALMSGYALRMLEVRVDEQLNNQKAGVRLNKAQIQKFCYAYADLVMALSRSNCVLKPD